MENKMLLRMSDWNRIRLNFTEEEKSILNAAITGETICPRGCVIDEEKAGEVAKRIRSMISDASYKNAYGANG